MSKKVLVIGGTGFFGTALVQALRSSDGVQVTYSGRQRRTGKAVGYIELDVLNKQAVSDAVRGHNVVVNLAGQISRPLTQSIHINSIGMLHTIEACVQHHSQLVQVSSVLVYGSAERVDEHSPTNPESPYATCKAVAESLIQELLLKDQFLIVRMSNLYGENQTKGLFWYLLEKIKQNQLLAFTDNDGTLRRNFIHVHDAARILSELILADVTGILPLASREYLTIKEIIALVESIVGKPVPASFVDVPPAENIGHISIQPLENARPIHFTNSVELFLKQQLS